MTLLAIDPGRSYKGTGKARQTIGYAIFALEGRELGRGVVSFEELVDALWLADDYDGCGIAMLRFQAPGMIRSLPVYEVVTEDFVNDPQSARGGQRNGTSECIGAVEFACIQMGTSFTRQEPALLGPAKLHAGYEQKLKHLPHQDSAYLHGYEYLVRKGVLKPAGLEATVHENRITR